MLVLPVDSGHNYIGSEHLLLGLLREGEGVAARVLENLGADPSNIRTQASVSFSFSLLHIFFVTCKLNKFLWVVRLLEWWVKVLRLLELVLEVAALATRCPR